jgi:uncharacterized protein YjiS (DUF1127 family)
MQPHIAFLPAASDSLPIGTWPPRVTLARLALGLWRRARTTIAGWRAERAALAALDEFDDRMLRDVGLTRCGITYAVRFGRAD